MTTTARDLVEAGAYTMHDCNRIHQTADCLSAGHAPPLNRAEFKFYADLDKYELGLMRDIVRTTLIATFRKLAEDGPTEAMQTHWDAEGWGNIGELIFRIGLKALLRELEGLTP